MATPIRVYRIAGSPTAGSNLPKLPKYGFKDTFTRADASVLGNTEDGKAWQIIAASAGATYGIASGEAYCIAVNTPGTTAMAVVDGLTANGTITYIVGGAAGDSSGLAFRAQDISNYFWLANLSNRITLWKRVAGTATQLAQGPVSTPFVAGDTLTVVLNGTSITVSRNGTQVISITESALSTVTKHGIFSSTGSLTMRWTSITHTP